MARQEKVQIKGAQEEIPQKSVYRYTPGLEEFAKAGFQPVTPYVSDQAAAILQSLQATGRAAGDLAREVGVEQEKEGQAAALKGENAERAEKSRKYMEGFDAVRGSAAVRSFDNEMFTMLQEGQNLSVEEWNKAKEEVTKKYTQGKSDSYLKSFVPGAIDRDNHYDKQFAQVKFKQQQDELLSNTTATARQGVQRIFDDEAITNKASAMRAHLSDLQQKGVDMHLTRNQVSLAYLNAVGEEAITLGKPEMLQFTMERDITGNRLEDNVDLQAKIFDYKRAATAKRDALITKAEIEVRRAKAEAQDAVERSILDGVYSNNPAAVSTALHTLIKQRDNLTPEKYEHYHRALAEMTGTDTAFRVQNDEDKFIELKSKAAMGQLDVATLRASKHYLSRQGYVAVFEEMNSAAKYSYHQEFTNSGKKDDMEHLFDKQLVKGSQEVKIAESIAGGVEKVLNPNVANMRDRVYQLEATRLFNQYYKEEKKLPQGAATWYEAMDLIHRRAKYRAFEQYPSTMTDAGVLYGNQNPNPDAKVPVPGPRPSASNKKQALNDKLKGL